MSSVAESKAMDVDPLTPEQLQDALLSDANRHQYVRDALQSLRVETSRKLSDQLRFLKQFEPNEPQPPQAAACGMTIYSLGTYPTAKVLELTKRASDIYFERDFYGSLYDVCVKIWKDVDNTKRKKIILSGNAGIGKSWFQVYLLRRLLTETPESRQFRFVLRQVGDDFYLLDLETCTGFNLTGEEREMGNLVDEHGSILYLFEPALRVNRPPLLLEAPCLSTLSPRKNRIAEYMKYLPRLLYMPVGEYNELECIAENEGLDLDVLERNFDLFGGIFRYSLLSTAFAEKLTAVNARCDAVTAAMLRALAADIDDDQNSTGEGNISGFVLSYAGIPREGDEAFRSAGLTLTSKYVRQRIMNKMGLTSYHEHLEMLALVLASKAKDPTGKDLEESTVFMLSAGPKAVPWEYQGVQGQSDTSIKKLQHTKRKITRGELDHACVNYPTDTSYPLTDCVLVIGLIFWAFQTTWQYDHAFKLRTLRSFRNRLGIPLHGTLKILFVNPAHTDRYVSHHRDNYLAKGEDINKPILDSKKNILMSAEDVGSMWENTEIFVAFPKDKKWVEAIRSALEVTVNK